MNDLHIDFSELQSEAGVRNDADWEAPPHRFVGKKLPNGKSEKEPVYIHQSYPAVFYGLNGNRIVAKQVNSEQDHRQLGDEWKDSPAAFGYIGAPSFEQIVESKKSKEKNDSESQVESDETGDAPRRGRKPKETAEA